MPLTLDNCPFCGSDKLHITHQQREFVVSCIQCAAESPRDALFDNALKEWNLLAKALADKRKEEAQALVS